jgi:hypothetical protein
MTNEDIIYHLNALILHFKANYEHQWNKKDIEVFECIVEKMSNSDEDRKALIHKILEQGYINFATRRNYDKKIQESTISQNRGLKFACCSIIEGSSNEEELYEYFKREILRIENSGEQQVSIKEWKKE